MDINNLEISNESLAEEIISRLLKMKKLSLELLGQCESAEMAEDEYIQIEHYFGKIVLSCNEVVMNILQVNNLVNTKIDVRSLLLENEKWTAILGNDRAYLQFIPVRAKEKNINIYSNIDLARIVLKQMELYLAEIDGICKLVDAESVKSEKHQLRMMLGIFAGFHASILVSVFVDQPTLIPDDDWNWKETVDSFNANSYSSGLELDS